MWQAGAAPLFCQTIEGPRRRRQRAGDLGADLLLLGEEVEIADRRMVDQAHRAEAAGAEVAEKREGNMVHAEDGQLDSGELVGLDREAGVAVPEEDLLAALASRQVRHRFLDGKEQALGPQLVDQRDEHFHGARSAAPT